MPAQEDGARGHVDIHEVVHNPALDVVLDSVHQVPAAHIVDLDVGEVPGTGNTRKYVTRFVFFYYK